MPKCINNSMSQRERSQEMSFALCLVAVVALFNEFFSHPSPSCGSVPLSPPTLGPSVRSTPPQRRVVHKFSVQDDVFLLREVYVQLSPFSKPVTSDCWLQICKALEKSSVRLVGCRPRPAKNGQRSLFANSIQTTGEFTKAAPLRPTMKRSCSGMRLCSF